MNMRLDNWSVVGGNVSPYTPPELITTHIHGIVYGSDKFPDGEMITTAPVIEVTDRSETTGRHTVRTSSGSEYELGEVDPRYEELYPGALERLVRKAGK